VDHDVALLPQRCNHELADKRVVLDNEYSH
jgi:hypothetical protein